MNGSGRWFAEQAWLGYRAEDVLIEVEDGRIKAVTAGSAAPAGVVRLTGWTIPGFANVHSHAFQHHLRGTVESGGADFWEWRKQMYRIADSWDVADYLKFAMGVFREMLEAGITAVGEFHYLHVYGNGLGEALLGAARQVGIRITLLDACYLRGGMDGRPLEGVQQTFSDGDADKWTARMAELKDGEGVRIGAAIHRRAEVEECLAVEGCTPTQLLEREGILGPDLTAVHAIHVNDNDVSLLGRNRVSICACTTTERDLGDRVGPIRSLVDAGSVLCVGSDSNAVIDPFEEARGVELDQRRATGRRVLHQAEELFRAATVDGMRALGWDAGALRPGMLADFVTIGQRPPVLWRQLDLGYLMFCCSARDVTNVVVGGKTVVSK